VELSKTMADLFTDYEIIVINDGSQDSTLELIQTMQKKVRNIQLYNLSTYHGKEIATVAGLDNAIGDYVVTIDPALYSVENIAELVFAAANGADIVYGIRGQRDIHGIYPRMSILFYKLLKKVTGLYVPEDATDYRCYSRAAVNYFTKLNNRHRLLRVFPAFQGFRFDRIVVVLKDSVETKYSARILTGIRRALGIFLLASPHPMRFITIMALLGSFLNLLYAGYVVIISIIKKDVAEGWVSLSLQSAGMFFLICLILAMLAEYLFSLLGNAIGYPIYQISSESTSSVIERRNDLSVLDSESGVVLEEGDQVPH
jgi:glycosyltransferase involved in cell wall biosynthesis